MSGFVGVWVDAIVGFVKATGVVLAIMVVGYAVLWSYNKIAWRLYRDEHGGKLFLGFLGVLWLLVTLLGAYIADAGGGSHSDKVSLTVLFGVFAIISLLFIGAATWATYEDRVKKHGL